MTEFRRVDEGAPPAGAGAGAPSGTVDVELRHGAIGLLQSVVIAVASSAPGQATAVSIGALIIASSYAGGVAILLTTAAMLAIAVAYQRLNLWEQNAGASYVWVGRAINPYIGFLIGWIMLVAYILGTVSDILPIGPAVLSFFGASDPSSQIGEVLSATILGAGVTAFAVYGIQLTARFQMAIAFIEYTILLLFCAIGFYSVFIDHAAGTVRPTWDWLTLNGVGGTGSLVAGMLIAVYLFTGWDTAVYLSEETERPETNPGKAVIWAVAILGVFYTVLVVCLQGATSKEAINNAGGAALFTIAHALTGSPWDKLMAFAIVLSVLGTTQAFLISAARISFAMGRDRVIPPIFGDVHRRYHTPAFATVLFGVITIAMTWLYVYASSVSGAFDTVVTSVGVLFALFYAITGLATVVFYRRMVTTSLSNMIILGVLPIGGAAVLLWIAGKSLAGFSGSALWSMVGIAVVGVIAMVVARTVYRAPFFSLPRVHFDPSTQAPSSDL